MESFLAMHTSLTIFNVAMTLGLVVLLVAIYRIGQDNKTLHAKNQRERRNESDLEIFQEKETVIS